jgi:PAS domain-containing protein
MKKENQRLNRELKILNRELERRVEIRTREMLQNLRLGQVADTLLNNLPGAVLGIRNGGRIAFANRTAGAYFCMEDGLCGRQIDEIIHDMEKLPGDTPPENGLIRLRTKLPNERMAEILMTAISSDEMDGSVLLIIPDRYD